MENRLLPVVLAEEEVAIKAESLANKIRELEEHEDARKEALRQLKEEGEAIEGEISRLARIVRDRREDRGVDCAWQRNDERRTMDLVRLDTGAVVEYRAMSASEINPALPFPIEVELKTIKQPKI